MFTYMQSLREKVGYVSLKTRYNEIHAKNFPSLFGDEQIENVSNMDELTDLEETSAAATSNDDKEEKIASLEAQVIKLKNKDDELKNKDYEINNLREVIAKTNDELTSIKASYDVSQRKINFTRKTTEELLIESISSPSGFRKEPALIGVYSATLNEDEFEIDEESREIRSRKDQFLQSIESRIDPTSTDQKERFIEIKNQILDKVRKTKVSRLRSRSGSSVGSPSSRKRSLSNPREDPRTSSRPRTHLPIPSTK